MPFPSVIDSFSYPQATDRLNNPSHSAQHQTINSVVGQIETVIGIAGDNSVLGTIITDLRSPGSDGGGHIQSANKGGTGQTTFTKGDILVATSSSVLAKLAVSSTAGEVLMAQPNDAAGIRWSPVVANKVAVNSNPTSIVSSTGAAVLYSASIAGSTLGTNNALKYTGIVRWFSSNGGDTFTLTTTLGNNTINSMTIPTTGSTLGIVGKVEGTIIANNSSVAQQGYLEVIAQTNNGGGGAPANTRLYGANYGTSSINTNALQNLVITGAYSTNNALNSILTGYFVVEKIA